MRMLVLHGGAIGDFILTLGLIQSLRVAVRAEWVTLIGRGTIRELAGPDNGIDRFCDLDAGGFHALFGSSALDGRAADAIAGHQLAINLLGEAAALDARLVSAGVGRVISIDPRPRTGTNEHITTQWSRDLVRAGIDLRVRPAVIRVPADELAAARDHPAFAGAAPIVLHPGSGSRAKCWPLENWAGLANRLRERGRACVTLLGPAERERFAGADLSQLLKVAAAVESESLLRVAAWLSLARAYIGNDSGISHLAAAVEARTLAIFGPTAPTVWRPYSDTTEVIGSGTPHWPSLSDVLHSAGAMLINS